MALFRRTFTRHFAPDGSRCSAGTPGSRKVKERSKDWYGRYRDSDGIERQVRLCGNKTAAQQMLNDLIRQAEREKSGLADSRQAEHAARSLAEHIDDFARHISAKNRTDQHVQQTVSRIQAALDGCGFGKLADLDADPVSTWLKDQRDAGTFGVTTSNGYVTALKMFSKWLMTSRRLSRDPFVSLSGLNARTDQRHVRRTLSPADFGRLLTVTRQSGRTFRGFDGETRFHLYLLAARSGLRCKELASLTARSFDFDADPPTVTIGASDEKARRGAVLPLPRDVAGALRQWLQTHQADPEDVLSIEGPSERILWPGSWIKAAAKMLRQDLQDAGIPYADEDGRVFDFHALRSQFITDLSRAGVPLATAQQLARHSDPRLTARNYTRLQLTDLDSAVQQLPTSIPVPLQATGTNGRQAPDNPPVLVTRLVTRFDAKTCDSVSPIESHAADEADEDEDEKTASLMRSESDCGELKEEAQAGFEPASNGFAIRRLRPLGYCA
jgi:integrase